MAGSGGYAPPLLDLETSRLLLSYEPEHHAGIAPAPPRWERGVPLLDEWCNECFLERPMGVEPTKANLERWRPTVRLRPHSCFRRAGAKRWPPPRLAAYSSRVVRDQVGRMPIWTGRTSTAPNNTRPRETFSRGLVLLLWSPRSWPLIVKTQRGGRTFDCSGRTLARLHNIRMQPGYPGCL